MRIDNVLGDGIGYVELLEWMGGDKQTVDRARVCYQSQEKSTPETDDRLLKKLVGSKPLHGTTMRGCVMTFDVLAPLFCVRQWTRHVVGHDYHITDIAYVGADTFDISSSYDEQSFRYTDKIQFYTPGVGECVCDASRLALVAGRGVTHLSDGGNRTLCGRCVQGAKWVTPLTTWERRRLGDGVCRNCERIAKV